MTERDGRDTTRFVSWNCAGAFDRDLAKLRALGADLAVLAEVPRQPRAFMLDGAPKAWHWTGTIEHKGLAIAGFRSDIERRDAHADAGSHCIAGVSGLGIGILGICAIKPKGSTYGREVERAIEAHASWLEATPSIVAGDFNISPFNPEDKRSGTLQRIFERLGGRGYVSLYHHHTGEAYGAEVASTYFHHRKAERGFHIDFCFAHESLLDRIVHFEVGTHEEYVLPADGLAYGLSDHVPLIVDIAIEPSQIA